LNDNFKNIDFWYTDVLSNDVFTSKHHKQEHEIQNSGNKGPKQDNQNQPRSLIVG
jgi:hypothetical protein